jgi:hypothetical protein
MKSLYRGITVLLLTMFLVQCRGEQTDNPEDLAVVPYDAVQWTLDIAIDSFDLYEVRPGATLGVFVADFLIHNSIYKSALAGIGAQMVLFYDDDYQESESYALLDDLGSILQVNIEEMLNRSNDRTDSFNVYVEELRDVSERSSSHLVGLEQDLEIIADERRLSRREASKIQSELNTALREQNYSTAGDLQRRLIDAEAELARIESEEDEQQSIIRLFEDLIEVAGERYTAMQSNREALIAGIKVIEVPGVDDLGLIEQGRRGRNRNGSSLFDPGGF